ncbi:acyl-CoA dehydrogenase family protein [Salinisphaera aquimarina]|uniref:Acyl-CoA dehydrogenase family protein n=1 Tax=Salinisphaera aquimarina TaxID=2094031 RepID=A0ABV7EP17_9GAMM
MSAVLSEANPDERRMLADSVAGFVRQGKDNNGVHRARAVKAGASPLDRETWQQMADLGWLGIAVPEASGGLGLGVGELAVVAEGLGGEAAPEPFVATAFAQAVLAGCDNAELVDELLGASATGDTLLAVAWQPAVASLALDELDERLEGGRLTATRRLVQPSGADVFVVAVRDENGLALYRLPCDTPGVTVETQTQVDGHAVATLVCDGVELGAADCLAAGAVGEAALLRGLCVARVAASAELLGLADRLFTLTSDYLASRKQFGAQLSSFQVLRHRAVDLYIQRELMRNALRQAVRAFDSGADLVAVQRAAARAKSRCADAALKIAREAVQLHGAIGYTEEADVGVYLRRVIALAAWLGNATAQRREYARLTRAAA